MRIVCVYASMVALVPSGCALDASTKNAPDRNRAYLYEGTPIAQCRWPSAARLDDMCSGVLLHPELVVYAAHCGATFSSVQAGGQTASIRHCKTYPDANLFGKDIAYCLLSQPLSIPIVVPAAGCEVQQIRAGMDVTLVGFGHGHEGDDFGTKRASQAMLREVTHELVVEDDAFGTCGGDSGGPAFAEIEGPDGSLTWRLVGILSSGPRGECRAGRGYYVSISRFLPWLEWESGLDLTPCTTEDGSWQPTPDCRAATMNTSTPESCGPDTSVWAQTCGRPFEPVHKSDDPPDIELISPTETATARASFPVNKPSGRSVVPIGAHAEDPDSGIRVVRFFVFEGTQEIAYRVTSQAHANPDPLSLPLGNYRLRACAEDYGGHRTCDESHFEVVLSPNSAGCSVSKRYRGTSVPCYFVIAVFLLSAKRRSRRRPERREKRAKRC